MPLIVQEREVFQVLRVHAGHLRLRIMRRCTIRFIRFPLHGVLHGCLLLWVRRAISIRLGCAGNTSIAIRMIHIPVGMMHPVRLIPSLHK